MGRLTTFLDGRFFPNHQDHWDDLLFADKVRDLLEPGSVVLDLGAGAGVVPELNFRRDDCKICGLDPDPRVLSNPHLDEAKIGLGEQIPYPSATFDLVVACNVAEHIEDVDAVLSEIRRVLKPRGRLVFKTPNAWHYVPLLARLTPTSFHKFYNSLRGRKEEDTFPTLYRLNSRCQISRGAVRNGLKVEEITFVEGRPEYLRLWWPMYLLGIGYERIVNATSFLEPARVVIVGVLLAEED